MSLLTQRPLFNSAACSYSNPLSRNDTTRGHCRASLPRQLHFLKRSELLDAMKSELLKEFSYCFNVLSSDRSGGWRLEAAMPEGALKTDEGDGSGGDDNNGKKGTGGNGSDDPESQLSPEISTVLAAAGRSVSSFPEDFAQALIAGKVSINILNRYLQMESNFLLGLLFRIAGFRERLLADPGFMIKVAIECGIGICTKSAAEYAKRQDSFWKELDLVTANIIMAILADFMLVWLPAPTLVYNRKISAAPGLFRWFRSCPDNAFQVVQKGTQEFTALQRFGSVIRNGSKLFGVGVLCSAIGVASTNALLKLRAIMDPSFIPQNPPQNVINMAVGYGIYMATSSNLRYQIVAGIVEERGIEVVFKNQREIGHFMSLILRTANTFLGSLLWVDFCRITGLQKKLPVTILEKQ